MSNLQLTRQSLRLLARHQSDPDLRFEKAFLMHLFGSPSVVDIFEVLIDWMPYGKRKDGSIYKSDVELARETGFSAKTVERSRKILKEAGFEIRVMKANGAPTNHYSLNLKKFVGFVARKLHTTQQKIRLWLEGTFEQKDQKDSDKKTKSSSQSDEMETGNLSKSSPSSSPKENRPLSLLELDKMSESLTGIYSNFQASGEINTAATDNESDVDVLELSLKEEIESLHLELGTSEADLRSWIGRYGLETVKAFTEQVMANDRIYSKGGWVRQALIKNYQQTRRPKAQEEMTAEELGKMYTSGSRYADYIKY